MELELKKEKVCFWSRVALVVQGENKGTVLWAWLVATRVLLQSLFISP